MSTKQYVGDPIHCWVPGHFTSNYAEYTNKVCWVSNTYYLPLDDPIPGSTPDQMINYYQWVPMILLIQAVFFYIPYLFWKNLSRRSGIDLNDLTKSTKQLRNTETKEKTLRYMLRQIDRYLGHYRPDTDGCYARCKLVLAQRCYIFCGKPYGNYLAYLYLFIKLMYVMNCISQLFLLDAYLSTDFHMYGIRVIKSSLYNEDWPATYVFPRETMCDFKIRNMGNVHRHTVQCVLPINFFNEKIYICIWFWLVFMALISGMNFFLWVLRFLLRSERLRFVKHYLRSMDKIRHGEDKKLTRKFILEYLRQDGVLILRLLNTNSNGLAVGDLVAEMWEHYLENPPITRTKSDEIDDIQSL